MITWEFLAGYFEGEGSIGYYRTSKKYGYLWLRVQLGNTNRWILDEIKKQSPQSESIRCTYKKGTKSGKSGYLASKDFWEVRWDGKHAIELLTILVSHFPDCSEKKPQIEFALRVGKRANEWQAQRMKDLKRTIMGESRPPSTKIVSSNLVLDFEANHATG